MKSPAFQFYAGDYLADANVQMMSLEQEGALFRRLCESCLFGVREPFKGLAFIGAVRFGPVAPRFKRGKLSPDVRRRVLAAGRCLHCSTSMDLQVDHIMPVSKGGTDEERNLQPLCGSCNRRKAARL
jgi:hypothetical protein